MKKINTFDVRLKRIKELFKAIKRRVIILHKPFAIHVEAIFFDDVWNGCKRMFDNKEITWFVMPPDPLYVQGMFKTNLTNSKIKKTVERYKKLKELGYEVQLHMHLPHPPIYYSLTKEQIKKEINNGMTWLSKNVGIKPTKIILGWFYFDEKVKQACNELGIHLVRYEDFYAIHDYDLAIKKRWM